MSWCAKVIWVPGDVFATPNPGRLGRAGREFAGRRARGLLQRRRAAGVLLTAGTQSSLAVQGHL